MICDEPRETSIGEGREKGTTGGNRDPFSSPAIVHRKEEEAVDDDGRR